MARGAGELSTHTRGFLSLSRSIGLSCGECAGQQARAQAERGAAGAGAQPRPWPRRCFGQEMKGTFLQVVTSPRPCIIQEKGYAYAGHREIWSLKCTLGTYSVGKAVLGDCPPVPPVGASPGQPTPPAPCRGCATQGFINSNPLCQHTWSLANAGSPTPAAAAALLPPSTGSHKEPTGSFS